MQKTVIKSDLPNFYYTFLSAMLQYKREAPPCSVRIAQEVYEKVVSAVKTETLKELHLTFLEINIFNQVIRQYKSISENSWKEGFIAQVTNNLNPLPKDEEKLVGKSEQRSPKDRYFRGKTKRLSGAKLDILPRLSNTCLPAPNA
jgi:hypothetical protein